MKKVGVLNILIIILGMVGVTISQPVMSSAPNAEMPHFNYKFEGDLSKYNDRLKLKTGEIKIGKTQEWGTLVYLWDRTTGERYAYTRDEVLGIERDRAPELAKKPNKPDLTVSYIERTPRDQGWHTIVNYSTEGKKGLGVLTIDPKDYQLHPEIGQEVTFTIHILNAGAASAKPFSYSVWMDDKPMSSGKITKSILPGKEETVTLKWKWEEGQHYIKVMLDTGNENDEIAKWNNTFIDPVRALTFFFVIGGNTYNGFANNPNHMDTFNFEDWARYHVHGMNWLFERSVWQSAPQGILERVRIDKIIVADGFNVPLPKDATEEQKKQWETDKAKWEAEQEKKWDAARRHNGDIKEPIMYNGNWYFGDNPDTEGVARWAAAHDWGLPHELGHQLGLVDLYWMNHGMQDVIVKNKDGNYQNVMHFYPWPQRMMHWHGPHIFSEISAGYLNHTLGRPRGFFGDYYYQIPAKNFMKVYSNTGKPLEGVDITLYQRWVDPTNEFIVGDWKCPWAYGPDPIFTGKTGKDGRYLLPNQKVTSHDTPEPGYHLRDNPWGQINVVGDNVLLLAKINYNGLEQFHWLRLHDANVGYLHGQKDEFIFDIYTRFPDAGAPQPPEELKPVFQVRNPHDQPPLGIMWKPSPSADVVQYRCYLRTSHGDQSVRPYRMFNIIPAEKKDQNGWYFAGAEYWKDLRPDLAYYGGDTYIAVTAVDKNGKESALSNVIYIPNWSAHNVNTQKTAIAPEGKIYISINAHETQLMSWDEKRGLSEIGFRDIETPHGFPRFWGIAVDAQNRLVATENEGCRIGLWTLGGDKVKVVGKKGSGEAEFQNPRDVAIDSKGRIYVADAGNHRIQVFDMELNFLNSFGTQGNGEMQFEDPNALGIVGDRLAVTDGKLGRVLIFDVSEDQPKQIQMIEKIGGWPDRALVAPSGNVYVTNNSGLVVYKPDGIELQKIENTTQGRAYLPRGLCTDGKGNAYFVNALPLANVLKIELK